MAGRKLASTTARGYGAQHQALRRAWAPQVARGTVSCTRCGLTIEPTEAWDLGHDDHDRSKYTGPEHAACNRRAAGLKGARIPGAFYRSDGALASREW
jgi:hypothetical protein